MDDTLPEDAFTVRPERVPLADAGDCRWSVYLMRVDLTRRHQPPALKIGMVGSGTVGQRRLEHERDFGPAVLLDVWTLEHAASRLDELWPGASLNSTKHGSTSHRSS